MKVLMYALISLATIAGLSACHVTSYYGGYIGSGIYHDDHYYPGWGYGHSGGWDHREDNWNNNRLERIERNRYREQRPGGNGDLHPPRTRTGIFSLETAQASDFVSSDARVITVAEKYDISDYAATYIVRAVELAKANDESGITDLGIEPTDFAKMMKGEEISSDKLNSVASKLLMTTDAVEQMIFDIKNDVEYANQ